MNNVEIFMHMLEVRDSVGMFHYINKGVQYSISGYGHDFQNTYPRFVIECRINPTRLYGIYFDVNEAIFKELIGGDLDEEV
jgi:hypothetical protein